MFNPAGNLFERVNSLIKLDEERGNKKETSDTKGLLKRVSAMDNTNNISKNKDLQFVKDVIVEMRKQQKEQLGVTDVIDDDKRILVTPAGKATTKEMKKELFKKMGVVQDA